MYRGLAPIALAILTLSCFGATAFAASIPAASPETSRPAIALGEAERIVLRPAGADPAAMTQIRVVREEEDRLILEMELPALEIQTLEFEGETFHALEISGGGFGGEDGEPMLPTFSRLIQIPDRSGVTIAVTSSETREFSGYTPFPMQPEGSASFVINRDAYARSGYGERERASIAGPALARGMRVVPITFSPVRYDAARQTLEVAHRIEVEVTFAGEDLRNVPTRTHATIPPSFDRLYSQMVVNYTGPRDGQRVSLGSYVIIADTGTTIATALEPLIEWRTRKGYEVVLHQTTANATSIKSWLQTAYNTWDNPPEYVCIVGDAGGTIEVDTWYESLSWYHGEGDHPYAQLDGTDVLADVHLGRISVDSVARLELYVEKIVSYESTPYMADTDWYTRACLVGDPYYSGPTCVQQMQWLKRRLLDWGYTQVDTLFSGVGATGMRTLANRGDTVFCYRGYYHMSGFDTGDIASLTNGRKMPFAVQLTCDTGSFASGYARSEAWIRAGVTGSTPIPTGGIGGIGTATTGTHTRYNNCVTYGIWRAIFWDGMFEMGPSLTRGKYELYVNYQERDANHVTIFSYWNSLMGDPAGEVWTDVPQPMSVSHPSQVALGANAVIVDVTAGGYPCAGAYVCLWKGDETHVGGYTGADGSVELPVNTPTSGTMKITVTKHDHMPHLDVISVSPQDRFVGYVNHTIDDDNNGSSSGNGDSQPNPGETIELPVQVRNFGLQSAADVTGTLTSDDPYVTIVDGSETFGTISAGATAWSGDDFDIQIASGTPNGHVICLGLDLESGADDWHSLIEIPVVAAAFVYEDVTLGGSFGSRIDPGESGAISVEIRNIGDATGSSVTATLISNSQWLSVTDAQGSFGTINSGATGENTGDPFGIGAAADCFQGHIAPMRLYLEFSGGALDTLDFVLQVGLTSSDDPTGPDAYGYYAFDNTDTDYPEAPVYDWVEIATNEGGSGIDCNLNDHSTRQGDSDVFDLPFTFTFYGEDFDRVTICSNGWIAMGATTLVNYRNWNIPCAGAPRYLIAPMWDGLYQYGEDQVYYYDDTANHRFIVQWADVRNDYGGRENFEVILYDPAHYPTDTGDGIIVFQFRDFNNTDSEQHYSTTGIQNGDMTDGLMYGYYNYHNAGAASVQDGRAIKFMALVAMTRGTLTGTIMNVSNGGTPIPGAAVKLVETGETMIADIDGHYSGSIQAGIYTMAVSHESFQPDTLYGVEVVAGETTVRNVGLIDIQPPIFLNTTDYGHTMDTVGPYVIETTVIEYSDFSELALYYNAHGSGWVAVPLVDQGENLYTASIPGQPEMTFIEYYLIGTDIADQTATDPADAPWNVYSFWVFPAIFDDDIEAGEGAWTHEVVTGGYVDQWHRSSQRNHTAGGGWSWKFGDTGGGQYTDLADGALITEPLELDGESVLTFWHWMAAEASELYSEQAYDGGLLEISVEGGAWMQITPEGGYTHTVRHGDSQACPFPVGTPFFSGEIAWTEVTVDLAGIVGTVQIRFRFGSDGGTGLEGWYIDDIRIIGSGPGYADGPEVEVMPTDVALYQNRPNPFGVRAGGTQIRFDLPREAQVQLRVVDATGRAVRTLVARGMPAGQHQMQWDGRDGAQRAVVAGVYFYILDIDGDQRSRRMLVLR